MATSTGLKIGHKVCGLDSQQIGIITSIANSAFEIRTADNVRMWVRFDAVVFIDSAMVQLICNSDRVHQYDIKNLRTSV